jgi:hypothetical protein
MSIFEGCFTVAGIALANPATDCWQGSLFISSSEKHERIAAVWGHPISPTKAFYPQGAPLILSAPGSTVSPAAQR